MFKWDFRDFYLTDMDPERVELAVFIILVQYERRRASDIKGNDLHGHGAVL